MDAAKASQPDAARAEREGRAAWAREGLGGVSGSKAEAPFDSNVITPGTDFMYKLSTYYTSNQSQSPSSTSC